MTRDSFANDLAEVCGERQVAAFVELRLIETRPASIDFPAFDRASKHKHDVGVAVVGAAIAIFAGGAAEFRHGHDDGVFAEVAEISPKSRDRLREIAEH